MNYNIYADFDLKNESGKWMNWSRFIKKVKKTYEKGSLLIDWMALQYLCFGLNHGETNIYEFWIEHLEAKEKHENMVFCR